MGKLTFWGAQNYYLHDQGGLCTVCLFDYKWGLVVPDNSELMVILTLTGFWLNYQSIKLSLLLKQKISPCSISFFLFCI